MHISSSSSTSQKSLNKLVKEESKGARKAGLKSGIVGGNGAW